MAQAFRLSLLFVPLCGAASGCWGTSTLWQKDQVLVCLLAICFGLFTWSLNPDDSAAINPWGSQGSLPLALCRCWVCWSQFQSPSGPGFDYSPYSVCVGVTLPSVGQLVANLWLATLGCNLTPTLKAPVNVWISSTSSAWSHRSLKATFSGLLPLCAPLLFLFYCGCHILRRGIVQSGIFPGFQMGNKPRGPCL